MFKVDDVKINISFKYKSNLCWNNGYYLVRKRLNKKKPPIMMMMMMMAMKMDNEQCKTYKTINENKWFIEPLKKVWQRYR